MRCVKPNKHFTSKVIFCDLLKKKNKKQTNPETLGRKIIPLLHLNDNSMTQYYTHRFRENNYKILQKAGISRVPKRHGSSHLSLRRNVCILAWAPRYACEILWRCTCQFLSGFSSSTAGKRRNEKDHETLGLIFSGRADGASRSHHRLFGQVHQVFYVIILVPLKSGEQHVQNQLLVCSRPLALLLLFLLRLSLWREKKNKTKQQKKTDRQTETDQAQNHLK